MKEKLKQLEKQFHGKIGLYALNTHTNEIIAFRENERFPIQSTYRRHYSKADLVFWHPITGLHVAEGMSLESLAEAAISFSDNTAVNLITKSLGGPKAVSSFAHSIHNNSFQVVNYEGKLNSNPNSAEDSSTPKDMALSLQKIVLGNVLTDVNKTELVSWMINDTVGYKKIRAGVPIGWMVADKTGSGNYGIANDIGVLWSPICKPIILAIYTIRNNLNAKSREDIVATVTSLALSKFAKHDSCFKTSF
jgi:beta-lactamase class A